MVAGPERAAVVLVGGRSQRMGSAKAWLDWHGTTLLQRTVGIAARGTGSDLVVVVRAAWQPLPELPEGTVVRDDPVEGRGPLQGLAVGLAAAAELGAGTGFVCSTDLPFLHVAYVRAVLAAFEAGTAERPVDVVLPIARGFRQPLAAGYRTALAPLCAALVAQDRLRPAFLFEQVGTTVLDERALRADRGVAAGDPQIDSVLGVNTPEEYAAARSRPAPLITLKPSGTTVRAARVVDLGLAEGEQAVVDGVPAPRDLPLVEGDVVLVRPSSD